MDFEVLAGKNCGDVRIRHDRPPGTEAICLRCRCRSFPSIGRENA